MTSQSVLNFYNCLALVAILVSICKPLLLVGHTGSLHLSSEGYGSGTDENSSQSPRHVSISASHVLVSRSSAYHREDNIR